MSVLNRDQIIKIAGKDVDSWIKTARKDNNILKAHYYGNGVTDLLVQIDELESDAEKTLRDRYAVSNEFLLDGLLRPFDNVFSSRGGSIEIKASSETIKDFISDSLTNVKDGLTDKEYLKQVWKENFIADPCGVVFAEVSRDGQRTYLTQKSIQSIRNMKTDGIKPEYIFFEADQEISETEDKTKETKLSYTLHWMVDDAMYYRIKRWADTQRAPEIIDELSIINSFGRVPAFQNSPIIDTDRKLKISPVWKQIDLLNKYLVNGSVKEIYIAKHGYPIFWMYSNLTTLCSTCHGKGVLEGTDTQKRGRDCHNCGGTGKTLKKDVADALLLNPPTSKDHPVLSAVAGYVQPDIATWQEQRIEQDWTMDLIYFSLWGATKERGENETATGRWIDVQPVKNRVDDFADITEMAWECLIDLFGFFYAPMSYQGSSANIARRFLLETPDQIWKKYLQSKKDGASETALNQLLIQYYESEYQNNDLLREYYLKVIELDPLPHNALAEIQALPVPQLHKDRKIYLSEFLKSRQKVWLIDTAIEELRKELDTFVEDSKGVAEPKNTPDVTEEAPELEDILNN